MTKINEVVKILKALIATLSDTEFEDDSDDNDDKGILNAFIDTVDPIDGFLETIKWWRELGGL